jgi:hypothetical protein
MAKSSQRGFLQGSKPIAEVNVYISNGPPPPVSHCYVRGKICSGGGEEKEEYE